MTHELKPRILVFGVGGAGGNAVDNMIEANLQGVEFIVANTDAQALSRSKTENRIQLGPETTSGLGAGARPDIGAKAAEESMDEIRERLEGAHMVFIAAGMGGGTGTGAAPVIARAAQEMNILTVAVVTKPFSFEGTRRMTFAEEGLAGIQKYVDTMIVVPNQNLFRIANDRTTFAEAFRMAAMMGMGEAEGENRALEAAKLAIDNPLLDDISMRGAKGVLINITGGYDMTLFELDEAANEVRREVDPDANIILGSAFDTELEGKIRVSVVAAGVDAVMPSLKQDAPVAETVRQPIAEPIEEEHVEPVAEVESETEVEVAAEEDDRPKVILHHASPLRSGDVDPRDDFTGQSLPAEHFEGSEGEDQIQADAVFSKQTEAPVEEDGRPSPSGFSNLFGWRRGAQGENDHAPSAESGSQIVSSPDDHPEPAPFDDADLEIPAFLRRSANH